MVEHGLSSYSPWALLPLSIWNLPGLGIKLMSAALAGGSLTTGPQGSPIGFKLILKLLSFLKGCKDK